MTLLVALKGVDGLVLAADSRGTFTTPSCVTARNDSQKKLHLLTQHVAALSAGTGELASQIVEELRESLKAARGLDGVTAVMNLLRDIARDCYQSWFPQLPPVASGTPNVIDRPDLVFLLGGCDVDEWGQYAKSRIYQLQSALDFAPMHHEYGFAVAGVVHYAVYLLNRLYQSDRSLGELTALAAFVISETASQDGEVGGPLNIAQVTPERGCIQLDASAVQQVLQVNQTRSGQLKDIFYGKRECALITHA